MIGTHAKQDSNSLHDALRTQSLSLTQETLNHSLDWVIDCATL